MEDLAEYWTDHPGVFMTPHSPRMVIERSRLADSPTDAEPGSVRTVWAPTGAGKTTLLGRWALEGSAGNRALVCLNLSEASTDSPSLEALVSYATYRAIQAIERNEPLFEQPVRRDPRIPRDWSVLDLEKPFTLIIDDVHTITNRRDRDWLLSLARNPKAPVRLRLAGHYSPFSPSIEGLLPETAELRAQDLAFTSPEIAQYFLRMGIVLTPDQLCVVTERTMGWPIAINLLSHLLRSVDNRDRFLSSFDHDEHALGDFLVSQLLESLPTETTDFLLSTAVAEKLTTSFAVHLSGRQDAGELLHRLVYLNLARELQTPQGELFSYHPILKGYLGAHLRKHSHSAALESHSRAQGWYVANGQPKLALKHALKAQQIGSIRALLDDQGISILCSGSATIVERAVSYLHEARAGTATTHTLAAMLSVPFVMSSGFAQHHLDRASVTLDRAPLSIQVVHAGLSVFRSDTQHDVAEALSRLEAASNRFLPGLLGSGADDKLVIDTVIFGDIARGWALAKQSNWTAASELLRSAALDARLASQQWLSLLALDLHAQCEQQLSNWHELHAIEDQVSTVLRTTDYSTNLVALQAQLGWATSRFQRCQAVDSHDLDDIRMTRAATNEPKIDVPAAILQSLIRLDGTENPRDVFDTLDDQLRANGRHHPLTLALASCRYIDLSLHLRGATEARDALRFLADVLGQDSLEAVVATAMLSEGVPRQRELETALELQLKRKALANNPATSVYGWLLLSKWANQSGRTSIADARVNQALNDSRPLRLRRPFLASDGVGARLVAERVGRLGPLEEYGHSIVRAYECLQASGNDLEPVGVLTRKEHEILRELPRHQSVSTIASNQQLSPNTIKTHLRSIYQKLGVSGRAEAVAAASEHGLL
ncbi:helix-turn-helix transcriptional regulator [Lysinibacter cavernae]|uniref:LuxR family maltose regulon positive regulatory protein n=1 Tax=Lysinibacter cavernae TaxID=1640652 RepID=A0A7X5QZE8_9MICO|nr:LuxR C-terminal-related transcriptional regulator [Lysinibacter cavernae]NIH52607.1 LuxR family maltose regulon positive regulatory protein [Lysinibacter cavernae]